MDSNLIGISSPEEVKRHLDTIVIDTEKVLERPRNFGWFGDDRMFRTWTLGPVIEHRDSGILDRSNARVLLRELRRAVDAGVIETDSWEVVSCNHWAVGYVEHLTYRVLDDEGNATRVSKWIDSWFGYLREQYPVADESDYSELETEETAKNVRQAAELHARRLEVDLPGEEWLGSLLDWIQENHESDLENTSDQGGYPSEDVLDEAFEALGWYKPEA